MNVLFTGKANLSFYTKQRIGGSSLSGIKLPESISTEQLEEQPENLKLLLLSFSSPCRSSGFFPDQCFFFPGEQGLQCLSLGSRNYLLQSRGQQHEAPSNAAEPLLTPPHPHALQTKWSREVPLHCRMSPKKSFRIPRKLSAPPSLLCVEERVWASTTDLAEISSLFVLTAEFRLSFCYSLLVEMFQDKPCFLLCWGLKKKKRKKSLTVLVSLFFRFLLKQCLLALNSFLFYRGS